MGKDDEDMRGEMEERLINEEYKIWKKNTRSSGRRSPSSGSHLRHSFNPCSNQEAKQAIELMGRWEMIDVCDALELMSPVFESEEIKMAHEKSVYDPGEEMEWKYRWRVVLQEKTEFNVQLIEFWRRKCYKSRGIEDKSWSIEEAKRGVSVNFLKVVVSKGSRNRVLEIKARKTAGGKIEVEVDKPLGLTLDPKSGAGGGVVITGVDGWECCKSRVEGG